MKRSFFPAAVVSILLYGCTTWTLTKRLEKKLISQECCEHYWTSPGGNTPQSTNCTATCLLSRKLSKLDEPGHCWRIRVELISDVLLWTPTYGRAKAWRPARTYNSYMSIRDVALKTCQRRWTIGRSGKRGSGTWWWLCISLLNSSINVKEVCVSIRWVNHCFCIFRTHFSDNFPWGDQILSLPS